MPEETIIVEIPDHEHDGQQGQCTICNGSGEYRARVAAVDARTRELIAQHGYTMMGVMSDGDDDPSFAYTIGLCDKGLPEILLVGNLPPPVIERIIAALARAWVTTGVAEFGLNPNLLSNALAPDTEISAKVVEVDGAYAAEHYTCQVQRFFPEHPNYRVAQLLWPDMQGHLPDDPEYMTNPALKQPVLPLVQ